MTGRYFASSNQTEFDYVMETEDETHWRNILDIISTLPGYEWLRNLMQRIDHDQISRYFVVESTPQLSQTSQTAPQGQISGQGNISNINTTTTLLQKLQQQGNDIDNDTMMAINRSLSMGSQYEDEQFIDDDDDEDDINRKIVQSQHPTVHDFDDSNLDSDEENSEERLQRLRMKKRENEKIHLQDQFQQQHHYQYMSTNPSSHQQQFQISQTGQGQTPQVSPSYQYPYAPTQNPYQQNNNPNTNTTFTSSNINTSSSSHQQQQQNQPENDVSMHIQEHATTPPLPSTSRIPSHRSDQYSHSDFEASQMNVEDNAGSSSDNGITDTTTITNIGRQQ